MRVGEVITVSFYSPIPETPVPTQPSAMTTSAGPYTPGKVVTFTWTTYAGCPADHDLSGFNIQTNGTIVTGGVTRPATDTSVDIKISSTVGDQTTVTYTALCTDIESPASPPVSVTVVAGP